MIDYIIAKHLLNIDSVSAPKLDVSYLVDKVAPEQKE